MAGAHLSTGDVLLFLDAHCECMPQWLEPLVERIRISRTNVVVPLIDAIDAETLEYQVGDVGQYEVSNSAASLKQYAILIVLCSWVDSHGMVTLIGSKFPNENASDNDKSGQTKIWKFYQHAVQPWPVGCLQLNETISGRLAAMMRK
jgi:Glycosyl transferase family 2